MRPHHGGLHVGNPAGFPEGDLVPSDISWLEKVTEGTGHRDAGRSLVNRWTGSKTNIVLSKIAKGKLKDFN